MVDISLRDYLNNLDALLANGNPSEVIHHCRHILQYFPKNADTYRILGRALFDTGKWAQAGEVFQRVLSVYPDDYTSLLGLSAISLNLKRPDDGLWYLERAFEQDPNNQPVLEKLRELYRKHRKTEHAKVQLTTGAVARQYIRNGLYEQAIDTLQEALQRTPDRADLRLLLARTFRELGYRVEAAEVALEVLKTLPDCLEANRILTELWLSEQRPSDAQRYLNHIQSVEPYLALELAQGEAVPDDSFKLTELDYRRVAEHELMTQAPDWLMDIDQTGAPAAPVRTEATAQPDDVSEDAGDWFATLSSSEQTDGIPDTPSFDEDFSTDLPDDWLSDLPDTPPAVPPPSTSGRKKTGLTGLLSQFNEPEEAEPEPTPEAELDMDDLFANEVGGETEVEFTVEEVEESESIAYEAPDLFGDEATDLPTPEAARQTGAMKNVDPLAWLHESGIEIVDSPELPSDDLFDAEDSHLGLQDADAADPMAWLQGYGGDKMLVEEASQEDDEFILMDEPVAAETSENDDPLAWLNDPSPEPSGALESEQPEQADDRVDPLDWLADEALLDEALSLEELVESPIPSQMNNPATPSVDRQEDMSDERDDNLDWLSAADSEPDGDELPDWLTEMPVNESTPTDEEVPEWLNDMPQPSEPEAEIEAEASDMPDWFSEAAPEEAGAVDAESEAISDSDFEWMSEMGVQEIEVNEPEPATADAPDWLNDMSPEQAPAAQMEPEPMGEDEFEWMSEVGAQDIETEEPEPATADAPDWLNDMSPKQAPAEFHAEPQVVSEDEFEWVSEVGPQDIETEEPKPATADVPDWLNDMAPEQEAATEFDAVADVPNDMVSESVVTTDATNWLDTLSPEEATLSEAEPQVVSEDEFEWMSEVGAQDIETEEPEVATDDAPDWLSEMSPEQELEAEEQEATEWTPDDIEFPEDEPAEVTALRGEGDDLSIIDGIGPATAEALTNAGITRFAQIAEMTPEELYHIVTVEQNVPMVVDTTESWPRQAQYLVDGDIQGFYAYQEYLVGGRLPEDEDVSDAAEVPEDDSQDAGEVLMEDGGIEWMSETEEEAVRTATEDVPDWLNEVAPAAEAYTETEVDASHADEFEWMGEVGAQEDEPEDADEIQPAELTDWMDEIDKQQGQLEDSELEPADVPDWMSEIGVQTAENDEFATVQDDTPDWLNEETLMDEGSEAEIEADTPDWLSRVAPTTTSPQTAQLDEPEDDEFAWGDEQETESGEALPDWLNNIQSQQSDTTPEPIEPVVSNEFSWIDDINAPVDVAEPMDEPDFLEAATSEDAFSFEDVEETNLSSVVDEDETPVAPTPASNAPDWLNAMVPGLDVDYDAPEDEPVEQSFVDEPSQPTDERIEQVAPIQNRREFDWLSNIVEEETQQIKAIQDTGRPRFVFSRQPAWLRKPTETRDAAATGESRVIDEDDFDDDVDVPPWLQ